MALAPVAKGLKWFCGIVFSVADISFLHKKRPHLLQDEVCQVVKRTQLLPQRNITLRKLFGQPVQQEYFQNTTPGRHSRKWGLYTGRGLRKVTETNKNPERILHFIFHCFHCQPPCLPLSGLSLPPAFCRAALNAFRVFSRACL